MTVRCPPADPFPEAHWGQPVLALIGCSSGDVEEGKALLEPVASFGEPIFSFVDAMPYTVLQTSFDAGNPSGERYYWKSHYLGELSDEVLDVVASFSSDLKGDFTIVGIEPVNGAAGRVEVSASAYPHRGSDYSFGIWTGWSQPQDDVANIAWTRQFYEAMKPFGVGAYVNYLDTDEAARVGEAYGANYSRLVEIKKKWDPDNLFRLNQNIAPE